MTDAPAKVAHAPLLKRLGAETIDRPDALLALAQRVHRLAPSHRDPHRYFEEKDAIEQELRRLARQQERTLA